MSRRRRNTALVVLLALLHTLGLGSGALRAAEPGEDCAASMASGPEMHGSAVTAPALAASQPASGSPGHESHPPCELPWAPRGCSTAAACLPLLVPAKSDDRVELRIAHVGVPAADVSAPDSPTLAPELPPPRA